jgi:hypothetical protein
MIQGEGVVFTSMSTIKLYESKIHTKERQLGENYYR